MGYDTKKILLSANLVFINIQSCIKASCSIDSTSNCGSNDSHIDSCSVLLS